MKTLLARLVAIVAILLATPAWAYFNFGPASPSSAIAAGGTEITLTGGGLDTVRHVSVGDKYPGGVPATIKSQSSGELVYISPRVDTTQWGYCAYVYLDDGSTEPLRFQMCFTPTISSVSPNAGPVAGRNTVEITGAGFGGVNGVNIGTNPAAFDKHSDESMTVTIPTASRAGPVTISMIGNGGHGELPSGYTYRLAPTITSVDPVDGPGAGGNTVTITGSDFTGATSVEFGGVAGTGLVVVSDTEITVKAPGGSGTVEVKVVGPGGNAIRPNAYTYIAAPTIVGVNPNKGTANTSVSISGVDLDDATVTFGGVEADVLANSETTIMVRAPGGSLGLVDIVVTTPGGSKTISDGFEYVAPPGITAVNPASGPSAGGNVVTISGSGFAGATKVDFGALAGADLVVVDDNQITVKAPAGAGTVDVTVLAPGGSKTLDDAYSYVYNGSITIRQETSGGDGTFTFASTTSALNLTITTSGGAGESGAITLPTGDYTVTAQQSAGFGLTSVACGNGGVGDLPSGSASISLGSGDAIICTFASTNSQAAATGLIEGYFAAQGAVMLGNLPDGQRRIDRLQGVVPLPGNPVPTLMGYMGEAANGALQLPTVSGSLAQIDALTGKQASPLDIWFQATVGAYQADDLSGRFGIVSLGADYLVSDDLLVGGFLSADITPDGTDGAGGSISGKGWLAGPYATMRLGDGLYLDVLAGAGLSSNTVSPDGSYTDSFDATRWLASATLSGSVPVGDWTISPTAGFGYFQSTSDAYLDGLGVDVPSVTGGLGQLTLGPNLGHSAQLDDGTTINTSLGFAGVLDLSVGEDDLATKLHGRLKAGVSAVTPGGASFGVSGGLDGLGGGTAVQSVSGSLSASVPIN